MNLRIAMHVCPPKFLYVRRRLSPVAQLRILDIGCGNNSPITTKKWFPNCHYSGADIQDYNNSTEDLRVIDHFYPLSQDGSGYEAIPNNHFDLIILNHVIEHMPNPAPILSAICRKLSPGGFIWIAFPSVRSLSLPSADGTLQFCDDPTHVYLPDIREVANVLFANGVKVVHAGQSRDIIRTMIGAVVLPAAFLRRLITGKLSSKGLWYILGFEDHVLGQRKP